MKNIKHEIRVIIFTLQLFFQLGRFQELKECVPIYSFYNFGYLNRNPLLHSKLTENCEKYLN